MTATEAPRERAREEGGRRDDPVVVGGVGPGGRGSVAALLHSGGLQLPGPMSEHQVSEWFTLLFRRPRWARILRQQPRPVPGVIDAMRLLGAMLNGAKLTSQQLAALASAGAEVAAYACELPPDMQWWPPHVPFRQISDYLARAPGPLTGEPWGWSHPLSHLFLEEMATAFSGLRFVYVVRDPLETAFSWNQTDHLRLWGPLLGLNQREVEASPVTAQLTFWLYSTRTTTEVGRRRLGERFMLLWYEHLREHPVAVARKLAAFAGLSPDENVLRDSIKLVEQLDDIKGSYEGRLAELNPELVKRAQDWSRVLNDGKAKAQRRPSR